MKIVLATENKTKVAAATDALDRIFGVNNYELKAVELEMGGPEPFGEEAIVRNIKTSLDKAKDVASDGDYYIGMEGGVVEGADCMEEVAYVLVEDFKNKQSGMSRSVSFQIPPAIAEKVKGGVPFADAVEQYFFIEGVKQGGGFVNILTKGIVSKKDLYFQPTVVALSKVLNKNWYK